MLENDPGVALAHWQCAATGGDVARIAAAVDAFAREHGMQDPEGEQVARAVAEVLDHTTSPFALAPRDAAVDAAIDGAWLTVIVRGHGPGDDDGGAAFATASAVADRVEWSVEQHAAITVLMEFAAGGQATADLPDDAARVLVPRRSTLLRRRSRARRPACS